VSDRGYWEELERPAPDAVLVDGVALRARSRVRLRPRAGGDIMDLALAGRVAVIEGIDQDTDGNVSLAVVVVDDPGRDLGERRQPGHRFFFAPEEVEPLARVLVAGIGNIFLGDDGFGCEVAKRLADGPMPDGVDVVDYGIRGFDLAYALAAGYESAVLIDAAPLGEAPGTLVVLEADCGDGDAELDAHGMDPVRVLRLARDLGGTPGRTVVLACEPGRLADPDVDGDVLVELSEPVRTAVEHAVPAVRSLVEELLAERPKGGDR
jgi:hydrogenase maturation protease